MPTVPYLKPKGFQKGLSGERFALYDLIYPGHSKDGSTFMAASEFPTEEDLRSLLAHAIASGHMR